MANLFTAPIQATGFALTGVSLFGLLANGDQNQTTSDLAQHGPLQYNAQEYPIPQFSTDMFIQAFDRFKDQNQGTYSDWFALRIAGQGYVGGSDGQYQTQTDSDRADFGVGTNQQNLITAGYQYGAGYYIAGVVQRDSDAPQDEYGVLCYVTPTISLQGEYGTATQVYDVGPVTPVQMQMYCNMEPEEGLLSITANNLPY